MSVIIRKATKADVPMILKLIQELADYEKESDAVEVTVEELERDGFGDNPLFEVLVAEKSGNVVGMALYYFRYSTWKGKSMHLEDLVVFENMRKQQIGTALYERFLQEALKQKVRRAEWAVLDWNTPARNFYKSSGAKILSDWEVVQMDNVAIQKYVFRSKK